MKISELKCYVFEGVKVRARVLEHTEGEKPSAFLIGKQSKSKKYSLITRLVPENNISEYRNIADITGQKYIEDNVTCYYVNVYKKSYTDENSKQWFLSFIDTNVTEDDNVLLTKSIMIDELQDIVMGMDKNKSPGIDGIPV